MSVRTLSDSTWDVSEARVDLQVERASTAEPRVKCLQSLDSWQIFLVEVSLMQTSTSKLDWLANELIEVSICWAMSMHSSLLTPFYLTIGEAKMLAALLYLLLLSAD